MAEESASDKNFPSFDVMSVFGLETEGDNQNKNKTKSKTTKGNNSVQGEGSTKKRRFAVLETGDLDALVEDLLAKKTKQATQWAVSVFTGRSQVRFKIFFSFKGFLLRWFPPPPKMVQTRLISIKIAFYWGPCDGESLYSTTTTSSWNI